MRGRNLPAEHAPLRVSNEARLALWVIVGMVALVIAPITVLTIVRPSPSPARAESLAVSAQTRAELLAARDAAWRAHFSGKPDQVATLLGPEFIAIQRHQDAWADRDQLINLARAIRKRGLKIRQLEFPRTKIQIFDDVAILYYTYLFETASGPASDSDAGRGTEVFVRRAGRWINVGRHLDHGAYVRPTKMLLKPPLRRGKPNIVQQPARCEMPQLSR